MDRCAATDLDGPYGRMPVMEWGRSFVHTAFGEGGRGSSQASGETGTLADESTMVPAHTSTSRIVKR